MSGTRRDFVRWAAVAGASSELLRRGVEGAGIDDGTSLPIVDTHQHLWDLSLFKLLWLAGSSGVLNRSYTTKDYLEATRGLHVTRAVYMEVDVDPRQHVAEAEHVIALSRDDHSPTVAAVIGGRPAAPDFAAYVARFRGSRYVKGVRQVLHSADVKPDYGLQPEFIHGVRLLGENGLSFDLCMRAADLPHGLKLTELCPDTRFIVDHCGNADPKVFRNGGGTGPPSHDATAWKRSMEQLAKRNNTICKISGIVASAPEHWTAGDLAPVVNHCLDVFGPDRVVFGGDWPVCLKRATFRQWVEALRAIVSERSLADQRKLWSENAVRFYGLPDPKT